MIYKVPRLMQGTLKLETIEVVSFPIVISVLSEEVSLFSTIQGLSLRAEELKVLCPTKLVVSNGDKTAEELILDIDSKATTEFAKTMLKEL